MSIYPGGYEIPAIEAEPNPPTVYKFYTANLITDELLAEIPFTDVSWGQKLSGFGNFTGTVPAIENNADLDLYFNTYPVRTALYLVRNGKAVWGGIIWSRNYSADDGKLSVSASSFESLLYRRFIWRTTTYLNTQDQYQIVRNLIGQMQADFPGSAIAGATPRPGNAFVGITVPDLYQGKKPVQNQLILGSDLKSVGAYLDELSNNLNGFEWNIGVNFNEGDETFSKFFVFRDTPPSQIPLGQTYTGTRPGLDTNIFEYPGNIMTLSLEESGDTAATRFWTLGSLPEGVDGGEKPRGAWQNDAYLDQGWPLIEGVDSSDHANASSETTLKGYAQVYGRRAVPAVPTWGITVNGSLDPGVENIAAGDWCRIIVNDDFIKQRLEATGEDETGIIQRIMGFSVSVPTVPQEPETVTLELADEWGS